MHMNSLLATLLADEGEAAEATLDSSMGEILTKLSDLVDTCFPYILGIVAAVVVVWGVYIGIRIAIANKNEEQINARGMVKNLIIGILIIAVIAVGVPLLIKGLAAWSGVTVATGSSAAIGGIIF